MTPRFVLAFATAAAVLAAVRGADADGHARHAEDGDPLPHGDVLRLLEQGRYDEACPQLEAMGRATPEQTTLLIPVARCREHFGRLFEAWVIYETIYNQARLSGREDLRAAAREKADQLLARLPGISVTITPGLPEGAVLTLDGVERAHDAWSASIPVSPGRHVVSLRVPGQPGVLARSIDVGAGTGITTVHFALPAPPEKQRSAPIASYVLAGAGGAGLVAGGVFQGFADRGPGFQAAALVSFGAGAAALVTAAILAWPPKRAPAVSLGLGGLTVRGVF